VKRIIDNHNGRLHVGSQIGKGTTFTITMDLLRVTQRDPSAEVGRRVVIIGGVTAGPKTAARLRRLDEQLDITIIEKGEFLSYSGCGLPGYISGKINSPRALMVTGDSSVRDIDFFETIDNIRILNHTLATDIDSKNQHVEVEDLGTGRRSVVPYDVLVIATGAVPSIPPIPGINQKGIFTLRSLEDAEKIRQALSLGAARDVYIIGGGIVGISAAEELQDAGARITILEKKEYLMQGMLDRDMALHVQAELNRKGIKILTNCQVNQVESVGTSLRIRTSSGSHDADLIIISAGVAPNVELARNAGLEIGPSGGIRVDRHLKTSEDSVFAVGDCAESIHLLTGKHEYWPLGSVSTKMGRIVADNICGRAVEFPGSVGTALFRIRDLNVARTGLTTRSAWKEDFDVISTVVAGKDHASAGQNGEDLIMLKIIADRKSGRLLGAQCFGRGNVAGKIEIAAIAISNGLTLIDVFRQDLGYSPAHNNPIELTQTACLMAQNKIDELVSVITPDELDTHEGPIHIVSVCPANTHQEHEIPGSINIPLERLRSERLPFPKSASIVVYSSTSAGAYKAYRYLALHGYTSVRVLEGGYLFWKR
jgi:NADPH-dependent 2,4-dienoyl-CoA reductase/sulfur reductase-like enzyme/rhodanese-related sulfurtransferase